MDQKDGTNRRNEVWIIIFAVAVVIVVLGALVMLFLTSV